MTPSGSGVECTAGHSFDRARQGHLTMLGGRGRRFPGDSVDQVASRERVLDAGVMDPVATALADTAAEAVDGTDTPVLLDVGAGTGFHLRQVVDRIVRDGSATPLGIGTELSVAAARRLARAHPMIAALVADTWGGLPITDGCADLVQVVFSPRNAVEFSRLLRPGGTLVVAVPGEGHLEPLRTAVGMLTPAADKPARLREDLGSLFGPGRPRVVDTTVPVGSALATDLALMGPSGVHLDPDDLARVLEGPGFDVRVHVEVWSYRRSPVTSRG